MHSKIDVFGVNEEGDGSLCNVLKMFSVVFIFQHSSSTQLLDPSRSPIISRALLNEMKMIFMGAIKV